MFVQYSVEDAHFSDLTVLKCMSQLVKLQLLQKSLCRISAKLLWKCIRVEISTLCVFSH